MISPVIYRPVQPSLTNRINATKEHSNANPTGSLSKNPVVQSAIEYVERNLCGYQPREVVVVVDRNQEAYKCVGGSKHLDLTSAVRFNASSPDSKMSIVHAHSSLGKGFTTPVGFDDFMAIAKSAGVRDIMAVNEKGQISSLTKDDNVSVVSDKVISKLENAYENGILDLFNRIDREKLMNLNTQLASDKTTSRMKSELLKEKQTMISSVVSQPRYAKFLDEFWTQYAKEAGMTYKSDMV